MQAYGLAIQGAPYLERAIAVEVGSSRGHGSTAWLAGYFSALRIPFHSVDFEREAHNRAASTPGTVAHQMVGEEFLRVAPTQFGKVTFAYLDNFDWCYPEWESDLVRHGIQAQRDLYGRYGIEMTNENSEKAHLEQVKLICEHRASKCVVILDDTRKQRDGSYYGKGGKAAPWLIEQGFRVFDETPPETPGYEGHVALVREE